MLVLLETALEPERATEPRRVGAEDPGKKPPEAGIVVGNGEDLWLCAER